MKRSIGGACAALMLLCAPAAVTAGLLDDILNNLQQAKTTKLSDTKIGQGLKEALKVGIDKAVAAAGKTDGYFGNQAIKILMPEKMQKMETLLRTVGFSKQIDDFTLSMNRAAEKAAPMARDVFLDALFQMNLEDAQKIYQSGGTAATDFFKAKTRDTLIEKFRPVVAEKMGEFSVNQRYAELFKKYRLTQLTGMLGGVNIENYVSAKAVDGLFVMLGQEEQKIRTDPKARVTALLKEVFGRKANAQ
ncbi:MAG TPA: DUF4197 domain-containing protein [bacterium]|nr:DUF4197 domain-containing protein [bacterium]